MNMHTNYLYVFIYKNIWQLHYFFRTNIVLSFFLVFLFHSPKSDPSSFSSLNNIDFSKFKSSSMASFSSFFVFFERFPLHNNWSNNCKIIKRNKVRYQVSSRENCKNHFLFLGSTSKERCLGRGVPVDSERLLKWLDGF